MMRLNLTSPEMQRTLRQYAYLGVTRTVAMTLIVLSVLFVGANILGNITLQSRASNLTVEADRSTLLLKGQQQTTLNDTTKRLNAQIQVLKTIQKKYIAWMPILQQFSALTTQGINISNITLAQNPAKISITGTADTRDHYTAYENALQASKILKDVEFPLQTKKTDIEFNMEFTLVLP